jgi:23S rRNA U2552 (ribose-2'-O)-methylase RlmE/FtsJ
MKILRFKVILFIFFMSSVVIKDANSNYKYDISDSKDSDDHILNSFIISNEILSSLLFYKNKIDDLEDTKIWDRAKKFSNDYELIHLPNKRNKKDSIALYEPLSRSYFKLLEMIVDYNLLDFSEPINVCCLAEGPGGFIECINNYRNNKDKIVGITLKSTNREIPGWKKSKMFLKENPNICITYGKDNTGDLYNLDNIKYLKYVVGGDGSSFITADGGFDFSTDFNNQEKMSYRIIYCEIVSALYIQKIGGNFVCKIFDIHNLFTVKLLWLLSMYYETVIICKPFTSRPANSEKYIICKNFQGIPSEMINKLFYFVERWETKQNKLDFLNVPKSFLDTIYNYNEVITVQQRENIKKTLDIIKNHENIEVTTSIIENQKIKAIEWCKKYNVEINKKSSFFL